MSRVSVETRKAYVITVGGKRIRFWTEAAAYYALARSLVGAKYLAPLWAYETGSDDGVIAAQMGITEETVSTRAARARILFYSPEYNSFDTCRWKAHIRRVAKKMMAMDRRRNGGVR